MKTLSGSSEDREAEVVLAGAEPRPRGREVVALRSASSERSFANATTAATNETAVDAVAIQPAVAPRDAHAGERDRERRRERREQADPGGGDHSARASAAGRRRAARRRRDIATISPRPTTTSDAATAITAIANTWPEPSPLLARERDQGEVAAVEHDLEREQHDQRRAAQQHAERADREEDRADREVPGDVRPEHRVSRVTVTGCRLREWWPRIDAADRRGEQHDRRHLEREQVIGQEQAPDLRRAAERRVISASCERRPPAVVPTATMISTRIAAAATIAPTVCQPSPPGERRVGLAAEVRDHEQEHHHHRARVDEHLRRRDELRREQQVEHGERAEVPDQRERRVERVAERDDRDARARGTRTRRRTRRSRRRRCRAISCSYL